MIMVRNLVITREECEDSSRSAHSLALPTAPVIWTISFRCRTAFDANSLDEQMGSCLPNAGLWYQNLTNRSMEIARVERLEEAG